MADSSGQTPTYIARCPECACIVAAAVAPVDEPIVMRDALKSRGSGSGKGWSYRRAPSRTCGRLTTSAIVTIAVDAAGKRRRRA